MLRVAFYQGKEGFLPSSLKWVYEEILELSLVPINTMEMAYVFSFDLLLLYGGGDISPRLYGQPELHAYPQTPERDAVEWILVRRALGDRIPTLGICRGMQLLNVAMGGTLHQDIGMCGVSSDNHEKGFHSIEFRETWLESISHKVNSRHHQCIKRVAPGLKVGATGLDGIIEMVYRSGFVGVQWHPESMLSSNWDWFRLFQWHSQGLLVNRYPAKKIKKSIKSIKKVVGG